MGECVGDLRVQPCEEGRGGMRLVFLYGAPGVGKLTVARELAGLTGYKLFHNHLTVDLVGSLFAFGSEQAGRLTTMFRLEMFQEAARANLPGIIFTFVYARGEDDEFIQQTLDAVEPYGGQVLFVLLKCEEGELLWRVGEESRKAFGKLRDAAQVRALCQQYELASPVPQRESLVLDTTSLPPQEAAQQIVAHFSL
jgi:RNase adaptor protein for sRNA GlmZ degradation